MTTRPTATFHALDHVFSVAADDPELHEHLHRILGALRGEADPAAVRYELRTADGPPFSLLVDGEVRASSEVPWAPMARLLHTINRAAVDRSTRQILLHAGACSTPGGSVVLPAGMEAGKSTLITGLVRAGLTYLTDEITSLDPVRDSVRAYPKPISLDPGSWGLFPDLRPDLSDHVARYCPAQWQVPVDPPPSPTAGGVRLVVVPAFRAGADLRVEPLARADHLRHLLACSFTLDDQPQRDLETLARLVERRPAYLLVHGDLAAAVAAILDLVGEVGRTPVPIAT